MNKVLLGGKLMFPSDYVAAIEFQGRDVTLTIAKIEMENLRRQGGGVDRKPIIMFGETKKKLVLNKTNASSIASMHGCKAEDWIGKKVTLYPTKTQCGRDTVDCIRVRENVREQTGPIPEAVLQDPEPHDEPDPVFGPRDISEVVTEAVAHA